MKKFLIIAGVALAGYVIYWGYLPGYGFDIGRVFSHGQRNVFNPDPIS